MIEKIIILAKQDSDIAVLWLYGSRAKKNARPDSDYDLAVAFKDFPPDLTDRYLRPGILTVEWTRQLGLKDGELSIVDINLAPIPLAVEIISANVILHVADPVRQIKEELRVSSRYELDILPHRKRYGKELLRIN